MKWRKSLAWVKFIVNPWIGPPLTKHVTELNQILFVPYNYLILGIEFLYKVINEETFLSGCPTLKNNNRKVNNFWKETIGPISESILKHSQ